MKKSPSLQTFAQYREAEAQNSEHRSGAVTSEGQLLEHQTLELRVHPPNVSANARQAVGSFTRTVLLNSRCHRRPERASHAVS